MLDTGFNIFHGKSPIFVYEVSWCSGGIGYHDDICPGSIHTDCLALSSNFSLNRLMDLDSMSKSSGSLRMALLDSLMPVVEV